jgi:hypothetical protein
MAALPRQSPVVVIDAQRPRKVTFYFADGGVCTVLRRSQGGPLQA